jgi:hypothetical protein
MGKQGKQKYAQLSVSQLNASNVAGNAFMDG